MALREDQIVRYGRQILLRELGGRGQERLLAAPIQVRGRGPSIDDAIAWLLAGGTPVQLEPSARPGGFLTGVPLEALNPDANSASPAHAELVARGVNSSAPTQVVVGAGVAFRTAQACEGCWVKTLEALGKEQVGAAGSLAALTLQRLVLGWSEPLGIILWQGDHFERGVTARCQNHSKTAIL